LKGTSGRNFQNPYFFDFRLAFFADRTLDFFAIFLDFLAADFVAAFFVVFVAAFFADAFFADFFPDFSAVFLAVVLAVVFGAFFEVEFFRGGITTNGGIMGSDPSPAMRAYVTASSPGFKGSGSIACFAASDTVLAMSFTVCTVFSTIDFSLSSSMAPLLRSEASP